VILFCFLWLNFAVDLDLRVFDLDTLEVEWLEFLCYLVDTFFYIGAYFT